MYKRQLAERYPSAAITTVDASREMIEVALHRLREQLPGGEGRVRFIESRFEELAFSAGSFDCVTSCISLHHVHDKADLYRKVRLWLAPGGTLRFADQIRGSKLMDHDLNWRRWLEFSRLPGNCTEAELAGLIDHAAAHDFYVPLPEHFRMLAEAGFDPLTLDCVWRNWMWGIVTAG